MPSSSWKWINQSGNWLYKQSSCRLSLSHSSTPSWGCNTSALLLVLSVISCACVINKVHLFYCEVVVTHLVQKVPHLTNPCTHPTRSPHPYCEEIGRRKKIRLGQNSVETSKHKFKAQSNNPIYQIHDAWCIIGSALHGAWRNLHRYVNIPGGRFSLYKNTTTRMLLTLIRKSQDYTSHWNDEEDDRSQVRELHSKKDLKTTLTELFSPFS